MNTVAADLALPAAMPGLPGLPGRGLLAALYELRFESLFQPGRALAFPCDERGQVPLDELSEPARRNYFYARAVIGREFHTPAVNRRTNG